MRIILEANGVPFAYLDVNSSTLECVDECDDPVVLFPAPGERDMTTLRQLIEEAAREEAPGAGRWDHGPRSRSRAKSKEAGRS